MTASSAWYAENRERFVEDELQHVVRQLATNAAEQGLTVETEQISEWKSSIGILQRELAHRTREIELLRSALSHPDLESYRHVILEFDFRRRGLRMDCVLLGDGLIAVIEFKRSTISAADRDQVDSYCLNLIEFHQETQRLARDHRVIVAPVLALTQGRAPQNDIAPQFRQPPWDSVLHASPACDSENLHRTLRRVLDVRRSQHPIDRATWLSSPFSPSSTIIDAAISLYGMHDVSAIASHAAPIELIRACKVEVAQAIQHSLERRENRIVFVSGVPGAGKTLVGLHLAFDSRFQREAVFVTGNSPLVDVLSSALKQSYRRRNAKGSTGPSVLSGYSRIDARHLIEMSTFKIVKAHAFLGERGSRTASTDGRVIIFDEAQRAYEEGRVVLGRKLPADEADLILQSLQDSYGGGSVVVALVGHNQAINRGELGIHAWLKAAVKRGWRYSIADETLALSELSQTEDWGKNSLRERLFAGHLTCSLRFYRNGDIERWASFVLEDDLYEAKRVADHLHSTGDTIWITRDLSAARAWAREARKGDERAGIIASGQARRLAAEGLFVDLKPSIANWMLAPSGDIRSGNMLESVQNQYQIQGLEVDYAIVCWDADLRRDGSRWRSYKMHGPIWKRDSELDIAKNGYRVLLTRARRGMMLFVPRGDLTGEDTTRPPEVYNAISQHLIQCGAHSIDRS